MSKDTAARAFFPGYVVPAILALVVLVNMMTGTVYWPARGRWIARSEASVVWGTVLLKLGLGVGLYAWYILANDDRKERLATPALYGGIIMAALGLIIATFGAF